MKTITRWKQDLAFESEFDGNTIELNGAVGPDGKRTAFGPKALLLSGLAGCSAIDVVEILKKMKVAFTRLEVTTETTQTEEHPRVFKDIYITFAIDAASGDENKVQKAVNLSLDKYCGVSAMLGKNSKIIPRIALL